MFKNKMARNILGPKKVEISNLEFYITRSSMIYTDYEI
jgi:hypothetical protein